MSAGLAADGPGRPEPMLLYLVKQVELAIRSHLDDLLRPIGLTPLQYTALTVLERHPDLSSAQLARNSFVTAQSMADMITALEERGLIERHRDKADRRRLVVALTGAGQGVLDRYRDRVNTLEEHMLAGLTKAQVSSLRRSLHACHANLSGRPGSLSRGQPRASQDFSCRQNKLTRGGGRGRVAGRFGCGSCCYGSADRTQTPRPSQTGESGRVPLGSV
ncbi:MAG: MarR family transcriptional regulator [Streptosporangiaceae bacterium]|nr:MarR family transcriptional regulator [Streptosporangiaceae bacterium]MBV9857164.1 MarR family transcriptional regulator [Streptosporangiaceae bacterium]